MSIKFEEQLYVRRLARYGVPLLILIFYVTASLHFEYSPEESYKTIVSIRDSSPESLWSCLLSVAILLKLNVLLAAKVLGLVFTCLAILLSYLIANEILHDPLLSFCAALTLSMQAWLLQIAPSGSGYGFALFLTLGAIFFLLRNEYIIAAVFGSLATLTLWQSCGVVIFVMGDIYLNSVDKRRAMKMMVSVALVFFATMLPWILYSMYADRIIVPFLHDVVPIPVGRESVGIFILSALAGLGILFLLVREREGLQVHGAAVLWIIAALVLQVWLLAAPFIIIYAFFALQKISQNIPGVAVSYVIALSLTTGLLLHHQFLAFPQTRQAIYAVIDEAEELKVIAMWIRTNVPDEKSIHMPENHEGLLQFYSERNAGDDNSKYIVSENVRIPNAELVFDPTKDDEPLGVLSHYAVWRKK